MRVWSAVFNLFAILLIMYMMVIFYRDVQMNENQLDQMRLDLAIDNATQAGFDATLKGGDIDINYQDMQNAKLEPEKSLPIFKTIMLLSYDMSLSDENMTRMDNYISASVLATENGYYIATPKSDGDLSLAWGLKKPYTIDYSLGVNKPDGSKDVVLPIKVAFNLSTENWVAMTTSTQANSNGSNSVNLNEKGIVIDRGNSWTKRLGDNALITDYTIDTPKRSTVTKAINKSIMDDVNYYIQYRNSVIEEKRASDGTIVDELNYISGFDNDFVYLPSVTTLTGINAIKKPTFFTTLANVDFAGTGNLQAKAVGGQTLVKKVRVIGFTKGGKKYYAYEGQMPDAVRDGADDMFNSSVEAALEGYYPHLEYLSKPIPANILAW